MNRYGLMAQKHWVRWLPARYAQIEDPDSFFSELGMQTAERIDHLALQLAGDDQPGEGYLGKGGPPGPGPVCRPSMAVISSADSSKSKTLKFSAMRLGLVDSGITERPCCRPQRSITWAGVLPWVVATSPMTGSARCCRGYRRGRR